MSTNRNPLLVKTRILILSDTHNAAPDHNAHTQDAPFRNPLPKADVALHCGDLTMAGFLHEYEHTLGMLARLDAELKLVIAGNHDVSLDPVYYARKGEYMHRHGPEPFDVDKPSKAREMWTGERARAAGIVYLDEGVHEFTLSNGARLRIYASPYQPEFCDWAFPYFRREDRYNPAHQCMPNSVPIAENPVPDFPNIDIMMTHGPPMGIRDAITSGEHVGCEHLLRAARRCKPRVHCFGHIHEGWGAEKVRWEEGDDLDRGKHVQEAHLLNVDWDQMSQQRSAFLDITQDSDEAMEFGKETLMVNASIMSITYKPKQGPWLIDLDLAKAT